MTKISGSFTHEGIVYQVNDAVKQTENGEIFLIPVSDLIWILKYTHTKIDPKRVKAADITVPILVTIWYNKILVLDGTHRLVKAEKEGITSLPAKYVDLDKLKRNKK